jgi:hypothetical protein
MFRSYKDKRRESYCKVMKKFWNDMSYGEQTKFRQEHFGLYLAIMSLIDWNEDV